MADIRDPFTPGPTTDPNAGVDPGTFAKVKGEWDTFLQNPQGRAALLSAGLAMMQPPSFGDTTTSMLGRAIGAAGQSATANQAMDIKESEAASKQDLRESQAMRAEALARTAGTGADLARERLEHSKYRTETSRGLRMLQLRLKADEGYNKYKKGVEEANFLKTAKEPKEEVMSKADYIRNNPLLLRELLGEENDEEVPAGVSSTTTGGGGGGGAKKPYSEAVKMLKANPALREKFNARFGASAADAIIGPE